MMERSSLGRDVLMISFSAFFADLGYQAVIAGGYPLYLTVALGAPPVFVYGIAEALNYGVGSLFSYIGGRISDRFGRKRVAIVGGNSLIPILSFTGLSGQYPAQWRHLHPAGGPGTSGPPLRGGHSWPRRLGQRTDRGPSPSSTPSTLVEA